MKYGYDYRKSSEEVANPNSERAEKAARGNFGKVSRARKEELRESAIRQGTDNFDSVALTKREYERLVKEEAFRKEMGWKPRYIFREKKK